VASGIRRAAVVSPIVVLNAKTIRGSTVGTRIDLQEAWALAGEAKVHAVYPDDRLKYSNAIFARMRLGGIESASSAEHQRATFKPLPLGASLRPSCSRRFCARGPTASVAASDLVGGVY
jgi:hypothetical protein